MRTTSSPFAGLKANLGVVFRADVQALSALADDLERLCADRNIIIAFKLASASRLYVKEGEP